MVKKPSKSLKCQYKFTLRLYLATYNNINTMGISIQIQSLKFEKETKSRKERERWSIDRYIITYSTKISSICVTSDSMYPSNGKQTNWFNGITFVMASQLVIAFAFESCEIKHNVCLVYV